MGPTTGESNPAVQDSTWDTFEPTALAGSSLWRQHCDSVNRSLIDRWFPHVRPARVLKTDLYDEATADGIASSLAARAESVVGVDVAPAVVAAAQRRHPWLRSVHADVRRLPFDDADFDVIVSISTLDHFPARAEMERALRELHRVLAPGGTLLITLDNLANPVVALRNALPLGPLQRLGLVPYYVGASCGPRRLRALLGSSGFEVEAITATMHCPRVACVRAAGLLHRHARTTTQRRFLRLLWAWERLGRLPTRFLTGYFVAARALKA